jgi:hypothetical protein
MGSVTDTFTGTAGTALASHTSDSGHSWTVGFSASTGIVISDTNRIRGPATVFTSYYTSWVPATADYDVKADAFLYSAGGSGRDVGPTGRQSTTADTYYRFVISFDVVYLQKRIAGTNTALANFDVGTPTANSTYNLRLQMRGTTIKGFVDDVERCSVTDSAISAAGRAGVNTYDGAANGSGNQLDNFLATDPSPLLAVPAATANASVHAPTAAASMVSPAAATNAAATSPPAALSATPPAGPATASVLTTISRLYPSATLTPSATLVPGGGLSLATVLAQPAATANASATRPTFGTAALLIPAASAAASAPPPFPSAAFAVPRALATFTFTAPAVKSSFGVITGLSWASVTPPRIGLARNFLRYTATSADGSTRLTATESLSVRLTAAEPVQVRSTSAPGPARVTTVV